MTLRLALVITGDSKDAKQALDSTIKDVERLGRKAGEVDDKARRAAGNVGSLGDAAKEAGPALGKAGDQASASVKGLGEAGTAAGAAAGAMSKLRGAFAGLAAGAVGGAIGAAMTLAAEQAVKWVNALLDNEAAIRSALESHESLIDRIGKKYRDAARGAYDYGADPVAVQRFEAQQNVPALEQGLRDSLDQAVQPGLDRRYQAMFPGRDIRATVGGVSPSELGALAGTVETFTEAAREGTPDVIKFREELSKLAAGLAEGAPEREAAGRVLAALEVPAKLQADLAQAKDLVKGLEGDSVAATRALGGLPKAFEDVGAAAQQQSGALDAFLSKLKELSGFGGGAAPAASAGAGAAAPQPFAAGGVVDKPTLFGYGGGKLGLMGEAGPEAIIPLRGGAVGAVAADGRESSLPLARMGDGRLGVKAFAGGGVIGAASGEFSRLTVELLRGKDATESITSSFARFSERIVGLVAERGIQQLLDAMFGGASAGGGNGGLFGSLIPFAKGGVVDRPEYFPMAGGTGLRGEMGPEAILPLRRGPDGALGVASAGSASPIAISFNVSTPDAGSFRRSEAQIAAMLSRAVGRGGRSL